MLLSLMRKHAKSWLIKFMIAIIAIVFTFYFGYSFRADRGGKVASVNGEVISLKEYEKAYRSLVDFYQQQYKGVWNESLVESLGLKERALNELIERKLVDMRCYLSQRYTIPTILCVNHGVGEHAVIGSVVAGSSTCFRGSNFDTFLRPRADNASS